jgi:hypothetical protein
MPGHRLVLCMVQRFQWMTAHLERCSTEKEAVTAALTSMPADRLRSLAVVTCATKKATLLGSVLSSQPSFHVLIAQAAAPALILKITIPHMLISIGGRNVMS